MGGGVSVLYVDDEPGLLEICRLFLEQSGEFRVGTATSAREALDLSGIQTYDAIISDYLMPGMDGIAFLKEVRGRFGDIPFILFTGRGREEVVIDAINNGADFYLRKGGDPAAQFAELAHKVRQAVGRRKAQDENILLKASVDQACDEVFWLDCTGTILYVNQSACRITGYTREDLTGMKIFMLDPDLTPDLWAQSVADLRQRKSRFITTRQRCRDGSVIDVEIMATYVLRDGKEFIFAFVRKITDRKRVIDAVRESDEKFRTIFENSPYPAAINSFPDNRFLKVNRAFLEASGFTEGEIYGRDPVELGLLSPGEAAKLVSRRLLDGKVENVPLALTAKDGQGIHVIFSSMPVTINDKPATVTVTAEVTRLKRVEEELLRKNEAVNAAYEKLAATERELRLNYGELKEKEAVLRESEEKFRALVEYSLDGIIITDFSGLLLFANRAAGAIVDSHEYEALIGTRNVLDFVDPESQADVLRDLSQVSRGNDAYLVQYKLRTERGREVWVECIGRKIRFGDSHAMLVSMRDITARRLTEAAVRESEGRFATVFKSSPVALTLVSAPDGLFVDVNDAFQERTGYMKEEVNGKRAESLGIFADRREYEDFVSSILEHRTVHGRELRCRIKSGEIRTCRFSSGIIQMGGKPYILSTVEDITERKAAESALDAIVRSMVGTTGQSSLRKITESVSAWLGAECVMIGEIQPDRQTVKVISMLLDGEEVGDYSYTLEKTPCENVWEKGFCLYRDNVRKAFPESRDLADLDIRGYVGTPLWDSGNNVIGILCALSRKPLAAPPGIREIMEIIAVKAAAEIERVQIERELKESRQMLSEAMEMAHLVNWEYDVATGMFTFDDRFYSLYGTTADREGGYRMPADTYAREFVHPEDRHIVAEEIEKAVQTTDPRYLSVREHRIVRRDGEVRHIVVHIGVTMDADGRTVRTHGANQDISDRKRTEEALRRANFQLNLLGRITRHDIINRISVVLGYLRIVQMKFPDSELNDLLKKIESNTVMIRSQIEFTKIYRDLGTNDPQWLELEGVMSRIEVPATVAFTADLRGIRVFADPMLEKVFFNLLDNSVRHGEQVTEIRVSAGIRSDQLVIVWEDNGIGVQNDEKEKIFEQGVGKNTGLGLFLAREILSLTGIAIRENGIAGEGARFEITVPKGLFRVSSR